MSANSTRVSAYRVLSHAPTVRAGTLTPERTMCIHDGDTPEACTLVLDPITGRPECAHPTVPVPHDRETRP